MKWEVHLPAHLLARGQCQADQAHCLSGARPKRTQRLSAETWGLLRLPLERVSGLRVDGWGPRARGQPSAVKRLSLGIGFMRPAQGLQGCPHPPCSCLCPIPATSDQGTLHSWRRWTGHRPPEKSPQALSPPTSSQGPTSHVPSVLAGPHSYLLPAPSDSASWGSRAVTNGPARLWQTPHQSQAG